MIIFIVVVFPARSVGILDFTCFDFEGDVVNSFLESVAFTKVFNFDIHSHFGFGYLKKTNVFVGAVDLEQIRFRAQI